ncbi:MAG: hypothetical protein WCF26_14410 [Candidatus Sulfotelmatobacter sp.]
MPLMAIGLGGIAEMSAERNRSIRGGGFPVLGMNDELMSGQPRSGERMQPTAQAAGDGISTGGAKETRAEERPSERAGGASVPRQNDPYRARVSAAANRSFQIDQLGENSRPADASAYDAQASKLRQ